FSPKTCLAVAAALFLVLGALAAATSQSSVVYIPFSDAKPIVEYLADVLPPDLRHLGPDRLERAWPRWVKHRDIEIRERLARGDDDSVINLLLFGTSFTSAARLTNSELSSWATAKGTDKEREATSKFRDMVQKRVTDFIDGLRAPAKEERLV